MAQQQALTSTTSNKMSPFADTPHLWLTSHLDRMNKEEKVVKIQALVRGHLSRKKTEIKYYTRYYEQHYLAPSAVEVLKHLGLNDLAEVCPPSLVVSYNHELAPKREFVIQEAKRRLKASGQKNKVAFLIWADYQEDSIATHTFIKRMANRKTIFDQVMDFIFG